MLRRPCVAGQFYPGSASALDDAVKGCLKQAHRDDAIAIIAPHAGYIYSGKVAGSVYSETRIPDNVILIGPNHTGIGEPVSIMAAGSWQTPLGETAINSDLAERLIESSHLIKDDSSAHMGEHSLEVQLPFIREVNPRASIVPITVMHAGSDACRELGSAIAGVIKGYDAEVLIVVSSDMNHYESDKRTRDKDKLAIERVLALDPDGLLRVTSQKRITMCGVIPAAIAINAAKLLGATGARLVDYDTSGTVSEDFEHVVGYAGIIME
jgi:hypothetical protein